MQDWAPVVTPNLAKKITTLRIVGSNMDDLDEGINPFSVVIVVNTTSSGEAAYRAATKVALKYDDLTKRVGVPLADLDIVQTTKGLVPDTFALAKSMLKGCYIMLAALIGDQHPLTAQYHRLLMDLERKETLFLERILKHDSKFGPARLLRFVQLHTRAWFLQALQAHDHAQAQAIPLPPFQKPLPKMLVNDMSWLPDITRAKHPLPPPLLSTASSDNQSNSPQPPTQQDLRRIPDQHRQHQIQSSHSQSRTPPTFPCEEPTSPCVLHTISVGAALPPALEPKTMHLIQLQKTPVCTRGAKRPSLDDPAVGRATVPPLQCHSTPPHLD
jgi:hypothetical protein